MLDEISGGLGVGDDGVDGVKFAEGGDGASLELGVVEAEDDSLSGLQHGALDVDKQRVGVGNAVERDTATTHDRDVGVHLGEGLDCERADQNAEPRINHTARHQHLNAVVGAKVVSYRQGVGNEVRDFSPQVFGCVIGGCAGVDDHSLIGLYQGSGRLANRVFFRQLMGVPGTEREFV